MMYTHTSIMSKILRSVFYTCHRKLKDNPSIPTRQLARELGVSRDTADRLRGMSTYTDNENSPTLPQTEEHQLKRENQRLRKQMQEILDERVKNDKLTEFSRKLAENPVKMPKWVENKHKKGQDFAIPVVFMSDWHLDERVDLAQMGGVNAYNRQIAEIRCGNFFDNAVRLAKKFINGIEYSGLYLPIGGDIFSGNIHEELKITNETTI